MNTTHTPGPWIIEGQEITAKVDPENSDTYFAPVCYMDTEWNQDLQQANTRLIAAAPDLLTALNASTIALQDFQREAGMQTHPKLNWQIVENLNLINKAKGINS